MTNCEKYEPFDPNVEPVHYSGSSGIFGKAGGSIQLDEPLSVFDGATISIPVGALDRIVKIELKTNKEIRPIGDSIVEILKVKPEGMGLLEPITLSIPVNPLVEAPKIFQFNADSGLVSHVPLTGYDEERHTIQGESYFFSNFFLAEGDYTILDASLHNTEHSIKASINVSNHFDFSDLAVDSDYQPFVRDLNNIGEVISYISQGNDLSIYGHLLGELYEGNLNESKRISSIKLSTSIAYYDTLVSVQVEMLEPELKILYTSDQRYREDEVTQLLHGFFSGESLVFDFKSIAENDKEYFMIYTWYLSSTNSMSSILSNRIKVIIWDNSNYSAFRSIEMEHSDPDINRNYINDLFEDD